MAITEDQDRTCWPDDTVCYKYNSLLQVRKQENHIIPIIPCHGGRGGWVQVRRGKNPRRESLDKDKDKTDSTTTNEQDPQDTPAGRRIMCYYFLDSPCFRYRLSPPSTSPGTRRCCRFNLFERRYSVLAAVMIPSSVPMTTLLGATARCVRLPWVSERRRGGQIQSTILQSFPRSHSHMPPMTTNMNI